MTLRITFEKLLSQKLWIWVIEVRSTMRSLEKSTIAVFIGLSDRKATDKFHKGHKLPLVPIDFVYSAPECEHTY